jgi:hypothetical protein
VGGSLPYQQLQEDIGLYKEKERNAPFEPSFEVMTMLVCVEDRLSATRGFFGRVNLLEEIINILI